MQDLGGDWGLFPKTVVGPANSVGEGMKACCFTPIVKTLFPDCPVPDANWQMS